MPSIYNTGSGGFIGPSDDHIMQHGDFHAIELEVGYLNFYTVVRRKAYNLQE